MWRVMEQRQLRLAGVAASWQRGLVGGGKASPGGEQHIAWPLQLSCTLREARFHWRRAVHPSRQTTQRMFRLECFTRAISEQAVPRAPICCRARWQLSCQRACCASWRRWTDTRTAQAAPLVSTAGLPHPLDIKNDVPWVNKGAARARSGTVRAAVCTATDAVHVVVAAPRGWSALQALQRSSLYDQCAHWTSPSSCPHAAAAICRRGRRPDAALRSGDAPAGEGAAGGWGRRQPERRAGAAA